MLAGTYGLSNFFDGLKLAIRSFFILFLDGDVDFFAVDLGIARRFNSQSDLAALNLDDHDFNIVVDSDAFPKFSR